MVRGLKCQLAIERVTHGMSHHASGAWIEIIMHRLVSLQRSGRITQVVRGLKYVLSFLFL